MRNRQDRARENPAVLVQILARINLEQTWQQTWRARAEMLQAVIGVNLSPITEVNVAKAVVQVLVQEVNQRKVCQFLLVIMIVCPVQAEQENNHTEQTGTGALQHSVTEGGYEELKESASGKKGEAGSLNREEEEWPGPTSGTTV